MQNQSNADVRFHVQLDQSGFVTAEIGKESFGLSSLRRYSEFYIICISDVCIFRTVPFHKHLKSHTRERPVAAFARDVWYFWKADERKSSSSVIFDSVSRIILFKAFECYSIFSPFFLFIFWVRRSSIVQP